MEAAYYLLAIVFQIFFTFFPLLLILAAGWFLLTRSKLLEHLDIQRLYFYIVSFVVLLTMIVAVLVLNANLLSLAFRIYAPSPDTGVKQTIADCLGVVLVTLLAWLWHWRRAQQLTWAKKTLLMHRIYLYVIAIIALVTAIGFGGFMIAQGFRALLGLIDLTSDSAQRRLHSDLSLGLVNGLLCLGLWWAHWRGTMTGEDGGKETG